ncbi:nitrogen fixation protein NifU [candidate division MSBL1 archaeon SCGC-AAA382A20]|uniref:Nitrogen fixation protein NifU n=1 Tax=candidate division MSBL1 archaeon SCGC-AAA382A20 TaxID=1698280 RepID=A0A133VKF7_9EURY|nr:nitrogen fixation protein NifU [candidate division MSBL1 archaeon SCGC-AAA382A20]
MESETPYSDKVIELFKNPKNVGEIKNPDGKAKEGSPACGDMVSLFIKVNEDTEKITDIKFKSYGCASNIATGSIITEMSKGKTIDEAKEITWEDAADELGGLPKIKTHCSVLAVDALREAIRDYEEQHGKIEEKVPTDTDVIRERLKHVMNPITGLDVVRTNLIENMEVKDGTVRVKVDLNSDHQFASAVKNDIEEKLEHLWDINEININEIIVEFKQ